MALSPEELMKPRYKVIADYPFNKHFTLGEVITLNEFDDREHLSNANKEHYVMKGRIDNTPTCQYITCFYESDFSKYPHIFKKMEWFEERKPEDIQYVKLLVDIPYWQLKAGETKKVEMIYKNTIWLFDLGKAKWIKPTALTPATFSEYQSQQSTI